MVAAVRSISASGETTFANPCPDQQAGAIGESVFGTARASDPAKHFSNRDSGRAGRQRAAVGAAEPKRVPVARRTAANLAPLAR